MSPAEIESLTLAVSDEQNRASGFTYPDLEAEPSRFRPEFETGKAWRVVRGHRLAGVTAVADPVAKRAASVSHFSEVPEPSHTVQVLQQWEGEVLRVTSDSFVARLHDISTANPDEQATFSNDEISIDDREFLAPGGVFFWSIGYRDSMAGRRQRFSQLSFRRLGPVTKAEVDEAREYAARLKKQFGW